MGWFLFRFKPAAKTKKAARAADAPLGWDPRRTWRGLKWLGAMCVGAAVVWGWQPAEGYLLGYVRRTRAAAVSPAAVQLVDAPAWMSESVRQDIRQRAADNLEADPFSRQGMDDAVRALKACAWVKSLDRIERRDGAVAVHARYRQPVAAIMDPATLLPQAQPELRTVQAGARRTSLLPRFHWVDAEGIVLPVNGTLDELDKNLVRLVGAKSRPAGPGETWPGKDVQAGVALAAKLAGQAFQEQVKAIDIGARDDQGRVHLVLLTDQALPIDWARLNAQRISAQYARENIRQALRASGRTGVLWGLAPGEETAVDPGAERKLIRLASVHRQYRGRIDAQGKLVDVSGAAALVLNPLQP